MLTITVPAKGTSIKAGSRAFPSKRTDNFLTVCRYVERNARRAGFVERADDWRWGSLWRWLQTVEPEPQLLSPWPIPRLPRWLERVNEPLTDRELAAIRKSAKRGSPFGEPSWIESTVTRFGLESTLCPRGRPQVRFPGETSNKES